MRVPARAVAAICLAVLALLTIGAVVLSVEVHPSGLSSKLRSAVSNTVSARSFTLQIIYRCAAGPSVPAAQRGALNGAEEAVTYRAPDALQIVFPGVKGQQQIELAIGSKVYVSYDSGAHWSSQQAPAGTDVEAAKVKHLLKPLQVAAGATGLSRSGNRISGTLLGPAFLTDVGVRHSGVSPHIRGIMEASFSPGHLQLLRVRFAWPQQVVVVLYRLTAVGKAPPIVAPAPVSVTPADG